MSNQKAYLANTMMWGNSVAQSWMWGLGLFFSVQFAIQFGLFGLLCFAIPNALGLLLFGLGTEFVAQRESKLGLGVFFTKWSRPFRLVFFLYQILALTLTIFAGLRYLLQPLVEQSSGLDPKLIYLYLPLTTLVILTTGCLFGEEFNIKRIKYSHAVLGVVIGVCMFVILLGTVWGSPKLAKVMGPEEMATNLSFWGYAIPLCVGLLMGPWLDLQQWQRAIQMKKEGLSSAWCYFAGSIIFFLMLLFHGGIALWCLKQLGIAEVQSHYSHIGVYDGYYYYQGMLSKFFFLFPDSTSVYAWLLFPAYLVFISNCLITTLDSGYISLKWFLSTNAKTSKHAIFSLIPEKLVSSPIPTLIFCGVVALFGAAVQLELEYFMIFYATFFVGYEALAIFRCFRPGGDRLPQVTMFCMGSIAVVMFSFGYFLRIPSFQICGSLLPLACFIWLLVKPEVFLEHAPEADDDFRTSEPVVQPQVPATAELARSVESAPIVAVSGPVNVTEGIHGHFEGKWFVHSHVVSYSETNSVGNVYFAQYAMWVGKARELFFNECLPDFDIENTSFYILTRSFTHKYVRETREFNVAATKIRIKKYNRKFVTLEHAVYDGDGHLLGEGEQSLMFVASKDYALIDIPQEVYNAFVKYV